jgi:hypothetical chaperone protein
MEKLGFDFDDYTGRAGARRRAIPFEFAFENQRIAAFRSALCFWADVVRHRSHIHAEAGPWAIQRFIEDPWDCRFMQSIKSFAASHNFQGTVIHGKRRSYEELLGVFFERLRFHAGGRMAALPARLVVGRPITYVGSEPDAQCHAALTDALAPFGFQEIRCVYEPVAAAFYHAQRLTRSATVLVADSAAATLNWSCASTRRWRRRRACPRPCRRRHRRRHLDYRIIDHVISPRSARTMTAWARP